MSKILALLVNIKKAIARTHNLAYLRDSPLSCWDLYAKMEFKTKR